MADFSGVGGSSDSGSQNSSSNVDNSSDDSDTTSTESLSSEPTTSDSLSGVGSLDAAHSSSQQNNSSQDTDPTSTESLAASPSTTDKLSEEPSTTDALGGADVAAANRAAGIGSIDAAHAARFDSSSSDPANPDTGIAPGGLSVTSQAIARQGYQTLVDNPQLTVSYEATQPAWKGTGGFSTDARTQLTDLGIEVTPGANPVPAGSISKTPGVSPQSVTTHNGQLAEQAIADRYAQIPDARVDQQFRYDANLNPVTETRPDLPGDRKVDVRVELDHPTDPRLNEVIEVESKATTRITPSKLNEAQIDHDVARLSRNGALRTAGQQLETIGKYARPVGVVLDAVDVVGAYRADGNAIGKNTGEAVSGLVAGGAGGWAGASTGAAIGTAIMPGVGTVVGGLVGAAIGAWGGDKAGRSIFGTVSGWFN